MDMAKYARYFYHRQVDEVQKREAMGDYYDLMMAAGLLRHLLLDDVPLIHRANREYRFKLKFLIARTEGHHLPGPENIDIRGVHPGPEPYLYPVESVREKELLSAYCMTAHDERYTVLDILQSCAYVRGGVHLRDQLSNRDQILFSIDFLAPGLGGTKELLAGIIDVVLAGLQPLTDAIAKEFKLPENAADGS